MTPPHHDDYLSTQLHDYHTEEAAPAHHLPFDRMSPAEPTHGVADHTDEHEPHDHMSTGSEDAEDDESTDDDAGHSEHVHSEHAHHEEPDTDVEPAAVHAEAQSDGDSDEDNGTPTRHQALSMTSAHAPAQAATKATADSVSSAADARGMLEGVAQSLRTLAGRDGAEGAAVAIFPRGVDVLEVRMHISRDRDIDLNFRVAGPTAPSSSI
jgi:hypothetical protein